MRVTSVWRNVDWRDWNSVVPHRHFTALSKRHRLRLAHSHQLQKGNYEYSNQTLDRAQRQRCRQVSWPAGRPPHLSTSLARVLDTRVNPIHFSFTINLLSTLRLRLHTDEYRSVYYCIEVISVINSGAPAMSTERQPHCVVKAKRRCFHFTVRNVKFEIIIVLTE